MSGLHFKIPRTPRNLRHNMLYYCCTMALHNPRWSYQYNPDANK